MKNFPKSPKEMTNGMRWFPRMLDKMRLHAKGELGPDYHENLGGGLDKRCVAFLRVGYEDLREKVLSGGSDEELLEWCFATGRRLDENDLLVWNHFVSSLGFRDAAAARLESVKKKNGIADRGDIMTFEDVIEFDEGRLR